MYVELLKSGRIRKQRVSKAEVQRALERASRDLRTARKIMAEDWDWGFAVTYNAILQASRAFMFAKAARLSAEGLLMTPRTTETDGFFVSVLRRA